MSLSPRPLQRNQSLQEQAYQTLRCAILQGELTPGQRLIETQLAEKLQVSRTPIRGAIRLLQHENLATVDAEGGLRVTIISKEDAAQLYDCRLALEQLSVTGACLHATESQLETLNLMVKQAETMKNKKSSQFSNLQLLDLDYRFHRLLAQSSGNLWLVSLLEQVFDKMQLLRIQTMTNNPNVLEIKVEHRLIYEAVAQKDVKIAVASVEKHLLASKERVIKEVEQIEYQNASSL